MENRIRTICIFGDSVAWGAYDPKNGGWVNSLRNCLESKDIHVYNCGVSGDNTDDLLKRFMVEAEAREPDAVIFAIGINDSQYTGKRQNSRVPKEKFISNLEELISQTKKITDKIIFIGLNHVEENKVMPIPWSDENKNYDNTNIDLYNSIVEEICSKYKIPFLNILDLLEMSELEDGLHPDTKGHEKVFVQVKDFLTVKKWI